MVLVAAAALLLPGLAWGYLLLGRRPLPPLERLLVGIGLSVVLVPLSIYLAHRIVGMPITRGSSAAVLAVLLALPLGVLLMRRRWDPPKD